MTILPFLGNRKKRKAMAQNVKEFSELVKDQYTFLMEQLEKVLKDYPECRVCGHRDLSPDRNENGETEPEEWVKACPCFDAENNWKA